MSFPGVRFSSTQNSSWAPPTFFWVEKGRDSSELSPRSPAGGYKRGRRRGGRHHSTENLPRKKTVVWPSSPAVRRQERQEARLPPPTAKKAVVWPSSPAVRRQDCRLAAFPRRPPTRTPRSPPSPADENAKKPAFPRQPPTRTPRSPPSPDTMKFAATMVTSLAVLALAAGDTPKVSLIQSGGHFQYRGGTIVSTTASPFLCSYHLKKHLSFCGRASGRFPKLIPLLLRARKRTFLGSPSFLFAGAQTETQTDGADLLKLNASFFYSNRSPRARPTSSSRWGWWTR